METNNTTTHKPIVVFTKWDYKTGKVLAMRRIFTNPEDFLEGIRTAWPGENEIAEDPTAEDFKCYKGAFKAQDDQDAPFAYRFELCIL